MLVEFSTKTYYDAKINSFNSVWHAM